MLNQADRLLIALSLLPRVGRKLLRKIVNSSTLLALESVEDLKMLLSPSNSQIIMQFHSNTGAVFDKVCKCEALMDQFDIKLITASHTKFPHQLLHIPDYPPYLFYKGDIGLASEPQIAIVGSRSASRASLQNAYDFSENLARNGLVITSGLAQGVDAYAHSGAVNNGLASIAVMGTGLDTIYPKKHLSLATKLLDHGCWISEYLPGSKPLSSNFPRRNRIISGLSLGVLIVEAREKSGTLITARMAIEQNREVFAIPGPIDYQGSVGCHRLIREGAILVQNYLEIIQELSFERSENKASAQQKDSQLSTLVSECKLTSSLLFVLEKIDYNYISIEMLANELQQTHSQLQSTLMELELLGYIQCAAGQCQRIK